MDALQARLKRYKDNAAKMAERYPDAHMWQNNRYPKPAILSKGGHTRSQKDRTIIYADCFADLPLTLIGDACAIASRMRHTGWHTSEDGDAGALKGAVLAFRNPHKVNPERPQPGADLTHLFYVAGTYHTDWDGVTVYLDKIHDTREDAAYYADECARIEAEKCREEDAIYQAEQRQAEAREELHRANKATLELIRETKAAQPLSPAICAAVQQVIHKYLADRAQLLKTIKTGA